MIVLYLLVNHFKIPVFSSVLVQINKHLWGGGGCIALQVADMLLAKLASIS